MIVAVMLNGIATIRGEPANAVTVSASKAKQVFLNISRKLRSGSTVGK